MEKIVLKEIMRDKKLYERIVVRLFSRLFEEIYKKGVKQGFNWSNKTVQ